MAQEPALDLPPPLPQWDRVFTLRGGAGYRDNVLRSNLAPHPSAFTLYGFEAIFSRLPTDGRSVDFFISGDLLTYLDKRAVDKEANAFSQLTLQRDLNQNWQASFALDALYQNQVLDVSATEADLRVVKVQGETFVARPAVRRDLTPSMWVSLETPVTRQFFISPLDDFCECGPKLTFGHAYTATSPKSRSLARPPGVPTTRRNSAPPTAPLFRVRPASSGSRK